MKEMRAAYIRDQLKKEIADMEMQITEIYGEHKLVEVENQVAEAENKLARLIVLNDASQYHESLSRRKALKDLRIIKLVDRAECETAKQLRGVQN